MTAGNAVMLYSGEEEVAAALAAVLVDAAGLGRPFGTAVGDVWAWVRASRRKRDRIFIAMDEMIRRILVWQWVHRKRTSLIFAGVEEKTQREKTRESLSKPSLEPTRQARSPGSGEV